MSDAPNGPADLEDSTIDVYQGSNGRFYTDWQVDRRLYDGSWNPCLAEEASGRRLVGTCDDELLLLVPTDPAALPSWLEIRSDGTRAKVVDTRKPVP